VSEFVDVGEGPSPPEASPTVRECQRLPVPRQIPPASEFVNAGERPNPSEASATVRDCQRSPVPCQIPPASDLVFTGERPSPPAGSVRCFVDGETIQGRLLLEDVRQSPSMSAPGFAGERPSPLESKSRILIDVPVIFQDCQRSLVSDSGYSTLSVCPPSMVENPAKDPDCQTVPGELSSAVNSESLDDALCSVLMRSQDGEDEGRLAVQPLNVLYLCAKNELEFPNWVIRCGERIHSRLGVTYIGHKW
jgi:hypothetical protein